MTDFVNSRPTSSVGSRSSMAEASSRRPAAKTSWSATHITRQDSPAPHDRAQALVVGTICMCLPLALLVGACGTGQGGSDASATSPSNRRISSKEWTFAIVTSVFMADVCIQPEYFPATCTDSAQLRADIGPVEVGDCLEVQLSHPALEVLGRRRAEGCEESPQLSGGSVVVPTSSSSVP